jgi:endonuclease G
MFARRSVFTALFLMSFSRCLLFQAQAYIDVALQMQLGNPSGAISDTNNHNHYLIQRTVEAIDYSDNLGGAVWASWDLTAGDVGSASRSSKYYTDTNLPPDFYRVTTTDYNGVGTNNFNRGHLCPSAARTDSTTDNKLVFFMSNIIPQSAANNQGVWGDFEDYCRSLLTTDELLIICGPGGFGAAKIPSGKVYTHISQINFTSRS